jgi:hypothetical protein
MTYQLAPFNPGANNNPDAARFDRTALWGNASQVRADYISTTAGMFQAMVGGQPLGIKQHELDVVILAQFPPGRATGRTFFEGIFDPANTAPPDCHSADGVAPSSNSLKPQSESCATCPQNAAGSGQTQGSRACRYNKTLAVAVPDYGNKVFTIKLSAQGLFAKHDPATNAYGLNAFDVVLGKTLPQEVLVTLCSPEGATGGVRIRPKGMMDFATASQYVQQSQTEEVKQAIEEEATVPGLAISKVQALPPMQFGAPALQAPVQAQGYALPPAQQPVAYQPQPAPVAAAPVYAQPAAPAPVYYAPQPVAPVQPQYQPVAQPPQPVQWTPPVEQTAPPMQWTPPVGPTAPAFAQPVPVAAAQPMVIPPVIQQTAPPIANVAPPVAMVPVAAPAAAAPGYTDRLAMAFAPRS